MADNNSNSNGSYPGTGAVEVLTIAPAGALDSITVYWHNFSPGRGQVTLTCWGAAWTAYFGGMSGNTIQEFFAGADVGYLVNKLGFTQWLKSSKKHEDYLGRIVRAVQEELRRDLQAVDHIDGDPTNNDPANLRVVTVSRNRPNRRA